MNTPTPTQTIPTSERLAQALEAELRTTHDTRLELLIGRARDGFYDDFKSDLPNPQQALVYDLRTLGHFKFAQRVIDGEFDATMEEAEAWANSPEGQAAYAGLLAMFATKE